VVAQLPLVVQNGVRRPFASMGVEPLAREPVERRVALNLDLGQGGRRPPDPATNIGEDISRLPLTNVQDVNAFQAPLRPVRSLDGLTTARAR
jgi:hypothetical protein